MYESLGKIYYANPQVHHSEYIARFTSPSAVHLLLHIKQFNHNKEFQSFFVYTQDLALLMERIYTQFVDFMNTLQNVTPIVRNQFKLFCVINEVHATSAIEGIHSTHMELKKILDGNVHDKHFSSIIKKYDMLITGQSPSFCSCQDIRDFYDEFAHVGTVAENPNNKLDGLLFRKEAVDVLSPSGKILHRGITPEDKIITALSEALGFLNDENCPTLVRIAVFHYLFVYIHPFYDSNGRTPSSSSASSSSENDERSSSSANNTSSSLSHIHWPIS